jgi:hypothetical protein
VLQSEARRAGLQFFAARLLSGLSPGRQAVMLLGLLGKRGAALRRWEQAPGPPDAFLSRDFAALHPVEVDFGHQWGLVGLRFCHQDSRLTLGLRWQCRKRFYGWLRCFAHVLGPSGKQISVLDHDLLAGCPPAAEWRPGDEGYEVRRLALDGWGNPAAQLLLEDDGYRVADQASENETVRLRLGLYETRTNLRLPLVASSLPVADDWTAVVISANAAPRGAPVVRFEPDPPAPCRALFAGTLELRGWSVTRNSAGDIWLRLGWRVLKVPPEPLRFFGHAVPDPDPLAAAVVSFDQDLAVKQRGLGAEFFQDVVRAAGREASGVRFLRAGVCTSRNLTRLEIRESSLDHDPQHRCVYLPVPEGARGEAAWCGSPGTNPTKSR